MVLWNIKIARGMANPFFYRLSMKRKALDVTCIGNKPLNFSFHTLAGLHVYDKASEMDLVLTDCCLRH